ncbi:MAG TPA: type II toxin-antitoxin system PemK/MazF family toxin [Thermoanaerobaculia bacterium]|nr:type II toxin-antitoxin system PemK/MazF family toxin [Thermoanaerobaculia bacterium]
MVIHQGEVWWADLPEPVGSEPGFRRPVIIVQTDRFNQSRIATALCVPLTSNVRLADSPLEGRSPLAQGLRPGLQICRPTGSRRGWRYCDLLTGGALG